MLDHWRDEMRDALHEVEIGVTWQEQRAKCLRMIMNTLEWRVIGNVVKKEHGVAPGAIT